MLTCGMADYANREGGRMTSWGERQEHDVIANGIKLHVTEAGRGPVVLLCHGFPESWYSWRHQIDALSSAGYRVIAPDMRGYGGSDAPAEADQYCLPLLVGDMVGLLDVLDVGQAVIVGHDWGSPVALNAALMRPDRFPAVATLSIAYTPRGSVSILDALRRAERDRFYQLYFQAPGIAEAELDSDPERTMKLFLCALSGEAPVPWDGNVPVQGLVASLAEPDALPPWLGAEDLEFYVGQFRRRGFRGPLNWYRNMDRNWTLMAPFTNARLWCPSLFLIGARDPVLSWQGGVPDMKCFAPNLKRTVVVEGAGHWLQQEAAAEVNAELLRFLDDDLHWCKAASARIGGRA